MEIRISLSDCGSKHSNLPAVGHTIEFRTDRLTDKGPCTTRIHKANPSSFVAYFEDDDHEVVVNLGEEMENLSNPKPNHWVLK